MRSFFFTTVESLTLEIDFLHLRPTEENPVSQITEDHFYSFAIDVCVSREMYVLVV